MRSLDLLWWIMLVMRVSSWFSCVYLACGCELNSKKLIERISISISTNCITSTGNTLHESLQSSKRSRTREIHSTVQVQRAKITTWSPSWTVVPRVGTMPLCTRRTPKSNIHIRKKSALYAIYSSIRSQAQHQGTLSHSKETPQHSKRSRMRTNTMGNNHHLLSLLNQ